MEKQLRKKWRIRKNTKISEKYQKFGKILRKLGNLFFKVSLKFGGKIRKNTENLEKYPEKFRKLVMKKLDIRKNTENSEKYSENQEKYQ